ncbi:MAG TPA: hypothetical protein ENK88_04920 [Campylobacterales bacterium]|nr:hypothetical protein [Campylobacterales bacterium]
MKKMNSKERIEIILYLNRMIEEEKSIGASVKSHLKDDKIVDQVTVKTSDKELKSLLSKLDVTERIEILQNKHSDIIKRNSLKQVKESKKIKKKFNFIDEKNILNFNANAGILKAKLTKAEINKLSQNYKDISSITLPSIEKSTLESAFNNIHMDTTSWPVSIYGGDGVGIFMREANGANCFEESSVTPIETLIGLGGGDYTEDRPEGTHANRVAQSLRSTSPESHIYCSDERYSLPSSWEDDIHVVNYSFQTGSESSTAYTSVDESADDFAYSKNVQLFISAGNGCNDSSGSTIGCEVNAPGKSHNSLTVGAYDDTTNQMADYSDWINPATGAMKPEILAPGGGTTNLTFAGTLTTGRGTSYASPIAAGMAASNISLMPSMKKHAGLIKASMLAMSVKTNIADHEDSDRNGATGIQWNPSGWYHWFEESNSYLDDADGAWMQIGSYNLSANRDAKVALSWLNRESVCDGSAGGSSYTAEPSHLCMDLALAVTNSSGNTVVFQHNTNRNWEAGEFNTGAGGTHRVYVWRTRNKYEWTKTYPWSSKKYHKNAVKMGVRIAYIDNRNEDEN